jgi:hypothetical protein
MSKLESIAAAKGALGVYLERSGTAVVVMPSSVAAGFTASDAAVAGAPVRVQQTDISGDSVLDMKKDLHSVGKTLPRASWYAFYLDLPTVRMVVQTNASAELCR